MSIPKINPTKTAAWAKLLAHATELEDTKIKQLFENNQHRFEEFSIEWNEILVDYSKNRATSQTMNLLMDLCHEINLKENIDAMFTGVAINETEKRAVLHTALRNSDAEKIEVDGHNIVPQIKTALEKIKTFSSNFIDGNLKGHSGKSLNTIVNIGIGGSDLGPVMVTEALKSYKKPHIQSYFVSNVDGAHLVEVLKKVNPETTLFIIASKTFTTQETMANAEFAKQWLLEYAKNDNAIKKQFIALSTNEVLVSKFGIDVNNMFEFWDWVGGRYSLWSSIGLSIACNIGYDLFDELLKGAQEMDIHFRTTPFEKNIPVVLALLGVWYNNFWDAHTHAILPYSQNLNRFAAYFQQGDMESNGKNTDRNGEKINYQTGPIIWGEPGTNGQHAFYQLIHQGTKLIPCDFIAAANCNYDMQQNHMLLLSNFFAQTEALMNGKDLASVHEDLKEAGLAAEAALKIAPFKVFDGNIPTNSILIKKLTPFNLGSLIAMYEHKIFTQGIIWNIFSFDQWGVELGKQLANKILPELKINSPIETHDSSTNGLINQYKKWRK